MRQTPFTATDAIHECAANCVVTRCRLTHDPFGAFCLSLSRLLRSLGEDAEHDVWKNLLRPLRRYRFALCAAPLSFDDPSMQIIDIGTLRAAQKALESVYPTAAIQLANVADSLAPVINSRENPNRTWLAAESRKRPGMKAAVLIRDSRLTGPSEQSLARDFATRWISVITPSQLSRERCFDVIYILGPANWFPPFVFDAPRASLISLARYSWIRDQSRSPMTLVASSLPEKGERDYDPPDDTFCDAGELLPSVDWRAIGLRVASGESENPLETVDARGVLLEGECAVFLETADGSSILTIDLDADDSTERIARVPTSDVRPGTFVLLRTGGGGDYVVIEADRSFLKGRAAELRESQRRWKTRLRDEIEKSSFIEVSLNLLELGSSSADEMNVRNYLSPRSIRTRSPGDFEAIMRLVGLGDSWEEYWNMMGEIDRAHRQAGRQIRRQLLHRLNKLDLAELERNGRLEITLEDEDAGSFTAFRVIEVRNETQRVPLGRIAHPFEL